MIESKTIMIAKIVHTIRKFFLLDFFRNSLLNTF